MFYVKRLTKGDDLKKEIETVKLENEIELTLKEKIDSSQREYLLREKIRIMKEELGEFTIKETEAKNSTSSFSTMQYLLCAAPDS